MTTKRKRATRPCRICGKWFRPDPRLKDRQKTCGQRECKRQWHARQCAKWNASQRRALKAERLQARLEAETRLETSGTECRAAVFHCDRPAGARGGGAAATRAGRISYEQPRSARALASGPAAERSPQESYEKSRHARPHAATHATPAALPMPPRIPRTVMQEVIGLQHTVIIEHVVQILFRAVQEVIGSQLVEIPKQAQRIPRTVMQEVIVS